MLTDRTLKALKPGQSVSDGRGTGLYATCREGRDRKTGAPTARITWVQRIAIAGKYVDLGLGPFPRVTLAAARDVATRNHELARAGIDPRDAQRAEAMKAATAVKAPAVTTVRDAAVRFMTAKSAGWRSDVTREQFLPRLERHAGALLDRDVATVTAADVAAVLQPVWAEIPVAAGKLKAALNGIFGWAIASGLRPLDKGNPCDASIMRHLLARPGSVVRNRHHAAPPWQLMPKVWGAVQGLRGVGRDALSLVLLTACRGGEVRHADWREFNLTTATWVIPAERMKGGRAHRVPLSHAAIEVLRRLGPRAEGPVFTSYTGAVLTDMGLLGALRRACRDDLALRDAQGRELSVHGTARATLRQWAADTGVPAEVAELCLAHIADPVVRAYQRSDLLDARRVVLANWADLLVNGAARETLVSALVA